MSNKIPYMPFYPESYLSDRLVRSMTLEQHGAYLLLLMEMWNAEGWLPDDDGLLMRILGVGKRKWSTLRSVLIGENIAEFDGENIVDHDLQLRPIILVKNPANGVVMITQKRLFAEYRKAVSLLERKREGGRKGGSTTKGVLKESFRTDTAQLKDSPSNKIRSEESNQEKTKEPPTESPGALGGDPSLRSGSPPAPVRARDVGNLGDNSPQTPEPTNQNIIRELADVYHETVAPDQHKASDWARLGQLYHAEGVDPVMTGIQALAAALRTKSIRDPLAYIASVARQNRPGPRDPPASLSAVPPAWHVLRRALEKELAKGEST